MAVTELIELSQDLAESGALTLLVVRVLAVRSRVLAALGRVDEAVGSAEEILTRTGQAREPESRQWAAWALEHVSRLLIADGRVDQGLNASVRLEAATSGRAARIAGPGSARSSTTTACSCFNLGGAKPL